MNARAAIGIGASLGRSDEALVLATRMIDAVPGIEVVRASRVYWSAPAGGVATRPFLNAVILVRTTLMPVGVHDACKAIELRMGRRPTRRWSDRVIDLDLLLFEGARVSGPVEVPHPRMHGRPFVLVPLIEVWPDAVDPRSGARFAGLPAAQVPLAIHGALPRPWPAPNPPTHPRHPLASPVRPS